MSERSIPQALCIVIGVAKYIDVMTTAKTLRRQLSDA